MLGENIRKDCIFKKTNSEGGISCKYPKTIKNCYLCSTYLANSGELSNDLKYIEHISKRKMNRLSLTFSFIAMLVSFITLFLKITNKL